MTGGSKIIGMWKDRDENPNLETEHAEEPDNNETLVLGIGDRAFSEENESFTSDSAEDDWGDYYETVAPSSSVGAKVEIALVSILALAWTGFFLWVNRDIFTTLISAEAAVELLSQWSMPVILLAVLHLLFMRNSTKESNRFADAASALRTESEQLEARLKTVNNELTIAREFLANETRELEFLGDQSSQKLTTAADRIKSSLEDGLSSMRKLDEVGGSAFNNLDQLREHLPVVINTAKDVTNQIGNTGRASQTQMAAMIATLKRVGEVGTSAKQSIDGLTESSNHSLTKLTTLADEAKASFADQFSSSENEVQRISQVLQDNTNEVIEALQSARTGLEEETAASAKVIKTDLEGLESTLEKLSNAASEEETRLKSLIAELNEHISKANDDVSSLDNEGGEKTAQLAFALKALEENNQSLQDSLEQGHGIADGMIERMEKLLLTIDSSTREMDETIPAALARVDEQSQSSMISLEKLSEEANTAGEKAREIAAQVEQTNTALDSQNKQLTALNDEGNTLSENLMAQISEVAGQLKDVQSQNEALTESAGEKLITALLRVKETAKQASEHSREAMEKSITGSAEKFEQISEEALNRIIDEKIGSIAPKLEEAVANAVATTESTASHLAGQLNSIEEMTTQLEQRILFAKEKAEQSSEENFTRRVALLTESLNSTAIDVSKILSNDVTDTEWAAYLKGDRGIFTRRAVRLLDNGEVREILAQYDANDEFREHVNRYIHDFEAMLRGVLSTRDGSAISVTLLSSDIGKLYVALAQAIERLRA